MNSILVIWVVVAVVGGGISMLILASTSPQIFDRPLAWLGRKRPALSLKSTVLGLEIDSNGRVEGLVYTGSVRNPGCEYWSDVVRRWESSSEGRGRLLRGVVWEREIRRTTGEPDCVLRGTTLYLVSAAQELCAIDCKSGTTLWQLPIGGDLLYPPRFDSSGHLIAIRQDDIWVEFDLEQGAEVARGQFVDGDMVAKSLSSSVPMFARADSEQMDVRNRRIRLERTADCAWSAVVTEITAAESNGSESLPATLTLPSPGRYQIDSPDRRIQSERFAIGSSKLVCLSRGLSPNQSGADETVELFAEFLDLEQMTSFRPLRLGYGTAESAIDIAYEIGDSMALRLSGVRSDSESTEAKVVTFVIDLGERRLVTSVPEVTPDGQSVRW